LIGEVFDVDNPNGTGANLFARDVIVIVFIWIEDGGDGEIVFVELDGVFELRKEGKLCGCVLNIRS